MNTISPYSQALAGLGSTSGSMVETGLSSSRRQSFSASESSSVNLSLKTREGDIVTINSASFSNLDSFSYDQKGKIVNNGSETISQYSYRTMTLESGSSFTFSVKGDLSDQELDDIESIVGSLDKVMAEMGSGDMDGAVETALGMTGYDTVSEFSADIATQRSYTMATEIVNESYAEMSGPQSGAILPVAKDVESLDVETLMEKMKTLMEESDKALLKKSQDPIDQLFSHHLRRFNGKEDKADSNDQILTDLRERMQNYFDKMIQA